MAIEQTGLEAVVKNINQFVNDSRKMQEETLKITRGLRDAEGQSQGSVKGFGLMSAAIGGVAGAFAGFAAGALTRLVSGIGELRREITGFAIDAAIAASRLEQFEIATDFLASRANLNVDATRALVDEIRGMGIAADVANTFVAELIRNQLDLGIATDLVAAAQNTAQFSTNSSTQQLEAFTNAIITQNRLSLRTAKVAVTAAEAYKAMAAEIGKTVEQLTVQERKLAFAKSIIEASEIAVGAYAVSMETAAKQIDSLTSRELPDLRRELGRPFTGALKSAVEGIRFLVNGIREAATESGPLQDALARSAAAFEVISAEVGNFVRDNLPAIINGIASLVNFGTDAFVWGADLIFEYSRGIIEATSTVLIEAMQFIGNVLRSWMAPGSPPRIAPDIDKWGRDTINEYFKGFLEGDFDILSGVATQLVDVFGSATIKLTDAQEDLERATKRLFISEQKLLRLRKQENSILDNTQQAANDLNVALARGASATIVGAKRRQFEAAKENLDAIRSEREEAERDFDDKKEGVGVLRDLVRAMKELSRTTKSLQTSLGGGGAGFGEGLFGGITDALEALKESFKEEFVTQFGDIQEDLEAMLLAIQNLGVAWGVFADIVRETIDIKIAPKLAGVLTTIQQLFTLFALFVADLFGNTALLDIIETAVRLGVAPGQVPNAPTIPVPSVGPDPRLPRQFQLPEPPKIGQFGGKGGELFGKTSSTQTTNNFNLAINTSAPVEPILADFRTMQALVGAA